MRRAALLVLLSLPTAAPFVIAPPLRAQAKPSPGKVVALPVTANGPADPYAGEAAILEHFDTTVRMNADGTGENVRHVVVRLKSEGAAQQSSVLSMFYNSANSDGTIEHVAVHKPDGTTIVTPSTDSVEMPAPVTREAPLYSDLRERQLPVRSVAAGDVLEYDFRTVFRVAEAPEQFWGAEHFVRSGVVLAETLTLQVPASKYVQVWCPHHPAAVTTEGGNKVYRWKSDQRNPTPTAQQDEKAEPAKDPDTDADGKVLPSVAWTTFHSWAEVGEWYRGLAAKRLEPDAVVRAKAEELTKGLTTPEEQVKALYAFVSEKTRYVGIDLGVGRFQPHAADQTLSNGYGDCKDKDTLLEALLRAKGFTTAPALVGVGITPVPDLPSPSLFNHVITTVMLDEKPGVPTRVWLDATPGSEPYRVLVPQIRGQEALVVPQQGTPALAEIPPRPPFAYKESFTADATLDKDGLLTGKMTLTARSDAEMGLRQLQRTAAPAQWDAVGQYLSNTMGFGGTVSHAVLRASPPDGPATVTWDYKRPDFADWANRRILPLFPGLEVVTIDKTKAPEHDIDQGEPRELDATTHISLPPDYRADMPSAIHVVRPYATFDQTYALSGGVLAVTRKVVILQKKVPKADWKDYVAYTKSIGMESGENYIQLMAPKQAASDAKTDKAPAAATDTATADSPADLIKRADQQLRQNNIAAEKLTLDELEKKAPDTPYLWSMRGYAAMAEDHPDEAIEDVKKELAKHPDDDSSIPVLLANFYARQKRYGDAVTLLQRYDARNDVPVSMMLSWAQQMNGDNSGAVSTLQRAVAKHPDDRTVTFAYGNALHAAHRDTEAAAVAKAAMDESDDAGVLNDNSYLLAETGTDLPLAEKNSRKAVELREAETAGIAVAEANSAAFFKSASLLASYDTLAYILLKAGKPAEAEPYQQAAWFGRQDITIGDHLALIQEASGHRDLALATNELAMATQNAAANKQDYAEAQANAERLRKAGAHSDVGTGAQALQDMRTFKVHRLPDAKGWGTFRVQVGADGIVDSDLVNGSATMKAMTTELNRLKTPGGAPPGSKARLLRDGVLSCSAGQPTCHFVFLPNAGLATEGLKDDTAE